MPGVISVRFTKAERQEMHRRQHERDLPSLSALVRIALGFDPDGGVEGFDIEELDHTGILRTLHALVDRLDAQTNVIKQIARAQGVRITPLEETRKREPLPPPAPADEDGWGDIPTDRQLQSTAPVPGFERSV